MPIGRFIPPLTAAIVAVLMLGQAAYADLLIEVDKSTQHMTVTVDGEPLYDWPVATGGRDYDTPSGTFKPFRMEIDHTSDEWDNAPMPYSIFFTDTGVAVHGTYEQKSLGRAVSHGCVRLSVKNAATLWNLVKREKMANTSVVVTGDIPDAEISTVTHSRSMPLNASDKRFRASTTLPSPFFLFGR
jgi:L,D-transpeptidase catalytic domain